MLTVELGQFSFSGEFFGANENFKIADLDADVDSKGDRPEAYNLEIAYDVNDDFEIAVKLEGNEDSPAFPEEQSGAAASYGIFTNTEVAFEYLHGEYNTGEEKGPRNSADSA